MQLVVPVQRRAIAPSRSALHTLVLDSHLHSCVSAAVNGDDPDERERVLREVTSVFTVSSKL